MQRQDVLYDSLPAKFKSVKDRWDLARTASVNFFSIAKYLDPLYNEFLIYRTLVKHLRDDSIQLIETSRRMLSALLEICGNRHRLCYYASDLPWLVRFLYLPFNLAFAQLRGENADRSLRATSSWRSWP